MSAISLAGGNDGTGIARVAADWLGLAAAPAFAAMALMTALPWRRRGAAVLGAWFAHERNGSDVPHDERVSCGAVAAG